MIVYASEAGFAMGVIGGDFYEKMLQELFMEY